jgi:FkbM family methyltransferase
MLLRRQLGAQRFHAINSHPAGWEIYTVMQAVKPRGDVHFFDIGCNDGRTTAAYARWFPRATGVLFEAHPDIAAIAQEGLKTAGLDEKFCVASCALGSSGGVLPLHVSTAAATGGLASKGNRPKDSETDVVMGSSSLLQPSELEEHYPFIKFQKTINVPVRRADDFLGTEGRTPDFLHIDVQGAELQVLTGFGERLAEVSAVWMEVSRAPLYAGAPGVQEVADWMHAAGFTCWVHAVGKVEGDQLWVRRDLPHNARKLEAIRHHRLRTRRQAM